MHTDDFLTKHVNANILLTYVILFLIIFSESAFIICPFLPGDALLFSVGVVATSTELNFYIVVPLLIIAGILGFLVNYAIGTWFGVWLLKKDIPIFQKNFQRTRSFMEQYGAQAIVISRFFPVVRTYLPFVAGIVRIDYLFFVRYTIIGAFLWVLSFTTTGYLVGEIPWVKDNYGVIFLGLILLTMLPFIYIFIKTQIKKFL